MDEAADVMAEHLTERLIDLCRLSPTSQGIPELRFNHVKGSFRVGAFMILRHEPFLIVREVVKHLLPRLALLFAFGVSIRAYRLYCVTVVSFIMLPRGLLATKPHRF